MAVLSAIVRWMRRLAEVVAVALLGAVFVSFLLQILFRYVLGWPVGWTLEVSTLAWMWLVLWGGAFVVTERDEIRFDILYGAVSERHAPRLHDRDRAHRSSSCSCGRCPPYSTT